MDRIYAAVRIPDYDEIVDYGLNPHSVAVDLEGDTLFLHPNQVEQVIDDLKRELRQLQERKQR